MALDKGKAKLNKARIRVCGEVIGKINSVSFFWFLGTTLFFLLVIITNVVDPIKHRVTYFMPLSDYIWVIGALWIMTAFFFLSGKRWVEITLPILIMICGLASLEYLYPVLSLRLPVALGQPLGDLVQNLNGYFFNRSYLYVVVLILAFYAATIKISPISYLIPGNIRVFTPVINPKVYTPWRNILIKFIIILAVGTIIKIFLNPVGNFHWQIFFATLLGALNTSLVEEILFRALLLPLFSESVGFKTGNWIQAVFFGLIHYPSFNLLQYIMKIVIFTFLGWLWGHATYETKGIGTSWLMHFAITIAVVAS